jgi:hypothetical protein
MHGKGYWKLNNSFLENDKFKTEVCALVAEIKEGYSNVLNCRDLWVFCKIKIREHSIKFASSFKKATQEELCKSEMQLNKIDDALFCATDDNEIRQLKQEQAILKNQVENFYTTRAKGHQIRSRAKWVEDGEKNSKYFLGLENKRQTNNHIATVKNINGHKVYKKELILKEVSTFYQNLYCPPSAKES